MMKASPGKCESSIAALVSLGLLIIANTPSALADGAQLFQQRCAACHQPGGQGVPGLYPRLAGRLAPLAHDREGRVFLAQVLLFGMAGKIRVDGRSFLGVMPGVPQLSNAEIAEVLNHVTFNLGGPRSAGAPRITAREVEGQRSIGLTPVEVHRRRRLLFEKLKLSDTPIPGGAASLMPLFSGQAENYIRWCQGCHLADGRGAPPAVPDFIDKVGYFTRLPEGRAYLIRVPGAALAPISDAELAGVLNFVLKTFSPKQLPPDFQPFTETEIANLRRQPMLAVKREREIIVMKLREAGLIP